MLSKIINDNFKISYSPEQEDEAEYVSGVLSRMICTVSGFSAETYGAEFSINIPLDAKKKYYLSFYKNNDGLYFGIWDKNKIYTNATVNSFRLLDDSHISFLTNILHQNEKEMINNKSFLPVLLDANVKKAWNFCIKQNNLEPPTLRLYVKSTPKEMTVREFYEKSIESNNEDFCNWIFSRAIKKANNATASKGRYFLDQMIDMAKSINMQKKNK